MMTRPLAWLLAVALFAPAVTPSRAAAQGMDLRQAAGVPLPAADLPAGTVSVRVVRGSFANNLSGETVTFVVDGSARPGVTTDASGRAQIAGLPTGARLQATATVDGERLESQEITIGSSGIRFVLVASETGGAGAAAPSAAAVPGSVFLGPDSRIVVDFANELLNVYYVVHVTNPSPSPVDLGGPLVFELPAEARSATMMQGSTPQATAATARVTVIGPIPPGTSQVNVAYTLPFSGDTARIEQRWPAEAQPFSVFALKTGEMDLVSAQLMDKQAATQQGQALVMARTSVLAAGETLTIDVTGLPHHAAWPANAAMAAVGVICAIGLWAAFSPASRRRAA